MSFKSILVHIDDNPSCQRRLEVAIRLALEFRAELVGMYLVPTPQVPPSVAAMLPDEVVTRRLREIGDAQNRAEAEFRRATTAAELAAIEWRAPAGSPVDMAVAHGRCADLFVIGQRDPESPDATFAEEFAQAVVLSTGRPTLIVPYTGRLPVLGQNVLVAWDGGREASRAIADALPFIAKAKQVVVFCAKSPDEEHARASGANEQLIAYLHRHNANVTASSCDVSDIAVGEWLLSRVADLNIDLVVMGAYGHTRLRELVLGGVTRTMLSSMTVPVLMSH